MYKVHCLNNISPVGLAELGEGYELTEDIAQADAILVRSADMHDMDLPASLKVIARAGAGVNNIPLQKCADAGIAVFNTPGANANAVKELVICGMLLAARDVIGGVEWVRENADDPAVGKAAEKAKKAFSGGEISGKTLGVIGLGAIGAKVAVAAEALGMSVVGYDPYVDADRAAAILPSMRYVADVADLYSSCDYVTVHVPAVADTIGMIGEASIARMKPGAVVLNFSRDTLVDDAAMAAALESGAVSRYVTDFANPAVVAMPRAIVLPHLGASTVEAEDNCAKMAVHSVMDYLERGETLHKVN